MIHESKSLCLAEVEAIINQVEDKDEKKEIRAFIKKFNSLSKDKAEKLMAEINSLGLVKIKSEGIVNIVDTLPEDEADLNRIFTESGLNKEESNKILEIVKKYK